VNAELDAAAAEAVAAGTFLEVVVAPSVPAASLEILTGRPKWGRNVRVLETGRVPFPSPSALCLRSVSGGVLVQTADAAMEPPEAWVAKTKRPMTTAERMDAAFAWAVVKHARSNAIVLAKGRAAVGIGAGQTNRLDAVRDACRRAGERARAAALASDAFFPFRDGLDAAAIAGVAAVVQPGGSLRDAEVIEAAGADGMAMAFTGARHFRHG
jgi:phosphoribosylaminoimidazolecarboxamide formyltransferase/IMP cyclohydrolase